MTAYFDAMRRYFDFQGRSTRRQFWLFTLFLFIISLIAVFVDGLIGAGPEDPGIILPLAYLAHLIPSLSVMVRRLHDIDRSGWWVLIGLVPLVGFIVLLVFACTASTAGANRFGQQALPQSALPPSAAAASADKAANKPADLDRLEKLAALKAAGAIDDDEFARLKGDIVRPASS